MSEQSTVTLISAQDEVEYRDIARFPGYRVGSEGSVWSRRRGDRYKRDGDRWERLRLHIDDAGRPCVTLYRDLVPHLFHVCRLVLEAFVGSCPEGMCCCHWDGNPANNVVSNLRWDTPKSNTADAIRHGTLARGERNKNTKLTAIDVAEIRRLVANGVPQRTVGRQFKISQSSVWRIAAGHTWGHIILSGEERN